MVLMGRAVPRATVCECCRNTDTLVIGNWTADGGITAIDLRDVASKWARRRYRGFVNN